MSPNAVDRVFDRVEGLIFKLALVAFVVLAAAAILYTTLS